VKIYTATCRTYPAAQILTPIIVEVKFWNQFVRLPCDIWNCNFRYVIDWNLTTARIMWRSNFNLDWSFLWQPSRSNRSSNPRSSEEATV